MQVIVQRRKVSVVLFYVSAVSVTDGERYVLFWGFAPGTYLLCSHKILMIQPQIFFLFLMLEILVFCLPSSSLLLLLL